MSAGEIMAKYTIAIAVAVSVGLLVGILARLLLGSPCDFYAGWVSCVAFTAVAKNWDRK
jgi:hypothetical protein